MLKRRAAASSEDTTPVVSTSVSPASAISMRVARAPSAPANPCTSTRSPTAMPARLMPGIESSNVVSSSTMISWPATTSVPAATSTDWTVPCTSRSWSMLRACIRPLESRSASMRTTSPTSSSPSVPDRPSIVTLDDPVS